MSTALPWLDLKNVTRRALGVALDVLVGAGAKGLSPAALSQLNTHRSED
jgi:hypothetical protein